MNNDCEFMDSNNLLFIFKDTFYYFVCMFRSRWVRRRLGEDVRSAGAGVTVTLVLCESSKHS